MTFEGTEGAGKSTLIREIERELLRRGFKVTVTREPGGNPVAERIRELILKNPMDPWTELFLYEAARAEHLAQTIRPALARGEIVLCDRYADSSLAYQAHARGLPWNEVKSLNRVATQGLMPEMTVHLDIDPATGLKRAHDHNRFEAEGVKFQAKVRQGFLKAAREEPKRWIRVNSERNSAAALTELVMAALDDRFGKRVQAAKRKG